MALTREQQKELDINLIEYAFNGQINKLKKSIRDGADIHYGDDLAVRNASKEGHLKLVKYLAEQGADINSISEMGYSAIELASMNDHWEVVRYLIENGVDVNANNKAIEYASRRGFLDVVKYLVEQGADIHIDCDISVSIASSKGHLDVVKYLVEQGADIDTAIDGARSMVIKEQLFDYKKSLEEKEILEDDLKDIVMAKKKIDPLRV